ncbi:MAG: biopolymer transporter ExbD [Alphaproteobacteria bacterium]|nr:biopolymer transporter ExbD [Alphaproteobacteria bacterium]
MAAALMGGGGRLRGVRITQRISDINVTPFVDVMLVLLVVFMIAAPLISTTVPVRLPNVEAKPITDQQERLVITLDREGNIFLMDTQLESEALAPRLKAIAEAKKDTRVSLRVDAEQRYGAVLDLMERLQGAGFAKVDLIFDPIEVALAAQRAQAQTQTQGVRP